MARGRLPSVRKTKATIKKVDKYRTKLAEAGFKIEPIPRSDTISIQKRRAQVWEMLCQGVPDAVMAELLKCTPETVRRDIAYWKTAVGGSLNDMRKDINKVAADLGTVVKKLDWIAENCFMEYSSSTSAQAKNNFLNTALKALGLRGKMLVDTGFYPKAGLDVNIREEKKITFADRFGDESPLVVLDDPVKRRKVIDVAEKVLKSRGIRALPHNKDDE